jgi:hypothetical protein
MGRHPQFSVAVDKETRRLLEEAARRNRVSLADEIRRRIDFTLYVETFDYWTVELASCVLELAKALEGMRGVAWHAHPKAHEAFAEALMTAVLGYQAYAVEDPSHPDPWGPDDPRTVGRTLAYALAPEPARQPQRTPLGVSGGFSGFLRAKRGRSIRARRGRKKKS